jgi:hypothetical protein
MRTLGGRTARLGDASSYKDFLSHLRAAKQANGGSLTEVTLLAHGKPGIASFANGESELVEDIAKDLVETGLLKRGGKLILSGCDIAGSKDARDSLYSAAKKYGITIAAQDVSRILNLDAVYHWTFHPDGRPPTPPKFGSNVK